MEWNHFSQQFTLSFSTFSATAAILPRKYRHSLLSGGA
jgi:hypothetical protein